MGPRASEQESWLRPPPAFYVVARVRERCPRLSSVIGKRAALGGIMREGELALHLAWAGSGGVGTGEPTQRHESRNN